MPVPALNAFGVLPEGIHDCTLAEAAAVFVGNDHRQRLWEDFQRFIDWINGQPPPTAILVDGSFASDKALPNDIDVVFDLGDGPAGAEAHWMNVFFKLRGDLKAKFRVDFWIHFPGAPNDLRTFFQYVKVEEATLRGMVASDKKGLLRIAP